MADPRKPRSPEDFPNRRGGAGKEAARAAEERPRSAWVREWADALVIAYLLAMFIRMFVAELYKIPSSSMTPTLLGTEAPRVGFYDMNGDGRKDMFLSSEYGHYDVYLREGERYWYDGRAAPPKGERKLWEKLARKYQDRIVVGKFLYWFTPPKRGDIAVFKVPLAKFQREKPIYIKRVTGLPGETLTFEQAPGVPGHENTMGYLVVNGKRVESPEFFRKQRYEFRSILPRVPDDGVYVFGDNTVSSQDSRYWGKVSFDRLRGRAIFRYNPRYFPYTSKPGFLK